MTPRRPRPRNLELYVVFDTSALFTGSASNFLRAEVADLIQQNLELPDLTIRWLVPEMVRHERQFQMLQEALQLLRHVERLERVLGHNLNITADILETRVKETIDRQINQHRIVVQNLSADDVNWARLLLDAAYRKPPFQLGEKEKGFRDAVILETFLQVVAEAPSSPTTARIVLVSNDQLLRNAANERLNGASNVYVLESVDALKGLINTLGSMVDEQFIADIRDKAQQLFYKPHDRNTLYYKAKVKALVDQSLRSARLQLPSSAEKYVVEEWTIKPARFVSKQGQRIHWSTRFEARLKAVKYVKSVKPVPSVDWREQGVIFPPEGGQVTTLNSLIGGPNEPVLPQVSVIQHPITDYYIQPQSFLLDYKYLETGTEQLVGYGTAHLDVAWSLAVTTSGMLTKPKLESVAFVEAVWD